MAGRDYEAFWKDLKRGSLDPCYYFYGPADVLKDEAIAELLERTLDPGLRDFNLDIRSAGGLSPEDVSTLCTTLPMMADRRVVVIRDVEAWSRKAKTKAAILRYLERPAKETLLILVQGGGDVEPDTDLAKACHAVEFGLIRRDHAERWVTKRAERHGVILTPEATTHLLVAVDGDLGAAASELAKLAGLGGEGAVSLETVASLLGVRHGETQDDWRDALLADEPARAAGMLRHVLAQPGMSGVKLVTLVGQTLVGLAMTRELYDQGVRDGRLRSAMVSNLKRIRVFGLSYDASAKAWAAAAPRWPTPRIRAALQAALAADQALKGTTISSEHGIITDLVISLAPAVPEAA